MFDICRVEAISPGSLNVSIYQFRYISTSTDVCVCLCTEGRRVSCKDLGQGDCHGWLHLKKEGRGFLHTDKWAKRWLVLHGHKLYGYKDKEVRRPISGCYRTVPLLFNNCTSS